MMRDYDKIGHWLATGNAIAAFAALLLLLSV